MLPRPELGRGSEAEASERGRERVVRCCQVGLSPNYDLGGECSLEGANRPTWGSFVPFPPSTLGLCRLVFYLRNRRGRCHVFLRFFKMNLGSVLSN